MPRFNFASKPAKQSNPDAGDTGSPSPHGEDKGLGTRKDSSAASEVSSPQKPEKLASDFISNEEIRTPSIPMDEAIPVEYRESDESALTVLSPAVDEPSDDDIPADRPEATEPETPSEPDKQSKAEDFSNPFEDLSNKDSYLNGDDFQLDKPVKKSRLPLLGIIAVVVVLLSLSILWNLNPFPALKTEMESFFKTTEPAGEAPSAELPNPVDTLTESKPLAREWNFYLQISAFKELYKAQSDANRFRKLGLHASVDGEYIPAKRSTYYKVRLGPFESVKATLLKADSLKDVIPGSAFIDSIRVEQDAVKASDEEPVIQPTIKKYSRKATRPPPEYSAKNLSSKDVKQYSIAASGYAVHVSSFKVIETAQQETKALIVRGLPAYTTKTLHDGTTWYRVLVGPFRTKKEAKRYLEIVKKEFGNTAYVRDLNK